MRIYLAHTQKTATETASDFRFLGDSNRTQETRLDQNVEPNTSAQLLPHPSTVHVPQQLEFGVLSVSAGYRLQLHPSVHDRNVSMGSLR